MLFQHPFFNEETLEESHIEETFIPYEQAASCNSTKTHTTSKTPRN